MKILGRSMSLKNESQNSVTILQVIVFLQFGICFSITVLTTIGISYNYSVGGNYLMALLQAVVAVPGLAYVVTQASIWIAVYVSFQLVTASSELYWLFYMIFDKQPVGTWLVLACLTSVNVAAVVVAMWFRFNTFTIPRTNKSKAETTTESKPVMKTPSTSISRVEESASFTKSSTAPSASVSPNRSKESTHTDMLEKSSKGSLKPRKQKKSGLGSKPIDSRETTNSASPKADNSEK